LVIGELGTGYLVMEIENWVLVKYFANYLIADTDFERLYQYPIANNQYQNF